MKPTDSVDIRILELLQQDGRMTNQDIAAVIGLSPAATLRRVRALEQNGLILGYTVLLNAQAIGLGMTVYVDIALNSESSKVLDDFENAVVLMDEVLECHLMSGATDYQLKLAIRDLADYERVHRNVLSKLPHVAKISSSFSIRNVVPPRQPRLPR
jgi:Lrp/AsnC family leucine-responsive transcriptional regulator